MSLRSRLFFAFFVMIAMNVLLGVILISSSWTLRSRYISYERERQSLDMIRALRYTFEKQRRSADGYMVGIESEKDRYESFSAESLVVLKQIEDKAVYPSEKEEVRVLRAALEPIDQNIADIFSMVIRGKRLDAIRAMESRVLPMMDQAQAVMGKMMDDKITQSDQFWQSAQRLAARTTAYSSIMLISVVVIGIGFSLLIYRSVSRPLLKLTHGARRLGAGEYDLTLDIQSPPELMSLARSFEEMAQSLKKSQIQIVQMGRMSAVGTLAGGVAHEINNPLTGVLGQAQLLLAKLAPDDPNRLNIEKIERAAQRCRRIVRGLLDFSRPQEYDFQLVEARQVFESALQLCETDLVAANVKIIWNAPQESLRIKASLHHLQQVFLNMMTNAMHAMPKGGTLTVEVARVDDISKRGFLTQARSLITSAEKFVEFSFKDSGIGIAPEHVKHLFDPFFTTKEPGKGTGLGLSISFGIVQQHHGFIEVESPGSHQGATFKILIPAA